MLTPHQVSSCRGEEGAGRGGGGAVPLRGGQTTKTGAPGLFGDTEEIKRWRILEYRYWTGGGGGHRDMDIIQM